MGARGGTHSAQYRKIGCVTGSSRSGLRTISAHTSTSAMTFMIPRGRFPIEIKTKIRYLIICGYHNFMR